METTPARAAYSVPGLAGGVHGDVFAHARGFLDRGGQLGFACIDTAW